MNEFIENLKRFNRKERYHLLKTVTQDSFRLCPDFRRSAEDILKVKIPDRSYCALDYHLDWIWASIERFRGLENNIEYKLPEGRRITGTQEDIDFIIAFEAFDNNKLCVHIVFVEAKNDTAWSSKQFKSKVERLSRMFPNDSLEINNIIIIPHLIIISPKEPTDRLINSIGEVSSWIMRRDKPLWIRLELDRSSYLKVSTDRKLNKWKIVDETDLTEACDEARYSDPPELGKLE